MISDTFETFQSQKKSFCFECKNWNFGKEVKRFGKKFQSDCNRTEKVGTYDKPFETTVTSMMVVVKSFPTLKEHISPLDNC